MMSPTVRRTDPEAEASSWTTRPRAWVPPTWEDVVRNHSERVYRLAYRLSGNKHDAEDITQDVFIRVFRSLGTYTPGTFEGWLHRITTNLFLDMVRRRARIRFDALPDDAERLVGKGRTPHEAFEDTHFDDDVQAALDALSPDFRAAVVLCDIEGLSYEEIAATLNVKLGTVRSRIHRGRAQLREALEHRSPESRAAWLDELEREGGPSVSVDRLPPGPTARPARRRRARPRRAGARRSSHLAGCTECRAEAEAQRRVKATAAGLGGAAAGPRAGRPADGAGPRRGRGAGQPARTPCAGVPAPVAACAPAPTAADEPPASRAVRSAPPTVRPARPRADGPAPAFGWAGRRQRSGVVLLGLGAVLVLGAPNDAEGPVVDPGQARFVVDHVATSAEVPFSTPPVGAAVTATYRR